MRFLRPLLILLASLLFSIPLIAQQSPPRDPQALVILSQALASMTASSSAVLDTVAEGTVVWADGKAATITIKSKGSDRLRHEINSASERITYVINQGKGYGVHNGKKRELPPWVTAYRRPEHIPSFSRLADFVRPNMKVAYVGLEDIAGRPAHHIRLAALPTDDTPAEIEESISEFHVFVDAESMLLVKTLGFDFSPEAIENRSPVETYYSDYRPVAGLLIPHRITRYVAGQKDCEITLTSVLLNVGLADSEFE